MHSSPLSIAVPLWGFRVLARLLPAGFRADYFAEAEQDLEQALRESRARHGALRGFWSGMRAVVDMAWRVPKEWWAVLRRRKGTGARFVGPGTGDRIMSWLTDLRQAARALARRPGFAATAALTLALGIGANAAIFTIVNAVLLRPLPFPDADDIVWISHHAPGIDLPELQASEGMLNFYWQEAEYFEALGAYETSRRNLVGGPRPERVDLVEISHQMFDVLRVQPMMGRPFNESDGVEGAPPVALLTQAAWRTRFGGDPGVIGMTIELDGTTTEIVGVMPAGFQFPDPDPVALLPLGIDPDGRFGTFGIAAVARLADGISVEAARQRTGELQARLVDFFPNLTAEFMERTGWSVTVQRYQDRLVGDVASALWVVLGTVGFVLLIACANVANLFLVRAEARHKELAVRSALGAGRTRVALGFLNEAGLLGLAGGALGVVLAWGAVAVLQARAPEAVPRMHEVGIDGATLAFAALLSLFAALVLGAFPLLRRGDAGLASSLRDGARGATAGRSRNRTRNLLVAGQLSLALVLLIGSALMLRSFQSLRAIDLGYDGEDVLSIGLSLGEGVANQEAALFYAQVADEAAALPGVASVALTSLEPLGVGDANGGSYYIEGIERSDDELPPVAMYKVIGGDYVETMGYRLVEGRDLERADWLPGAEPAILVNQSMAETLGGDAVGKGIRWDSGELDWARIVGVVADARERGIEDDPGPWAYLPPVVGNWGYPNLYHTYLLVRTVGETEVPVQAIRDIVQRLNPSVPLTSVRGMEEVVGRAMAPTSFTMVLLGIAAGMALFLGAIGLFGVISYVVGQRTREIGVRVALGARASEIQAMVFRQGAWVAASGVVLGLLGAVGLTRLMGTLLYGVSATDPISFVLAPIILTAVAITATWLPARRASTVDPVVALRAE